MQPFITRPLRYFPRPTGIRLVMIPGIIPGIPITNRIMAAGIMAAIMDMKMMILAAGTGDAAIRQFWPAIPVDREAISAVMAEDRRGKQPFTRQNLPGRLQRKPPAAVPALKKIPQKPGKKAESGNQRNAVGTITRLNPPTTGARPNPGKIFGRRRNLPKSRRLAIICPCEINSLNR